MVGIASGESRDGGLVEGAGSCPMEAMLTLTLAPAMIELGALPVFHCELAEAIHSLNRREATRSDFLAIAYPGWSRQPGLTAFGRVVRIFGSRERLEVVRTSPGIRRLRSIGMFEREPRLADVRSEPGDPGACFLRLRDEERKTPAALRRRLEDRLKKGLPVDKMLVRRRKAAGETLVPRDPNDFVRSAGEDVGVDELLSRYDLRQPTRCTDGRRAAPFMNVAGTRLALGVRIGHFAGGPVLVSTYGLSGASSPAWLPVALAAMPEDGE